MFDPWVGKIPWKRERLPTPVFWPGEFHGLYSPLDHKELDATEQISLHFTSFQKRRSWYDNPRDHQGLSLDLPIAALMDLRRSMRREECIPCTCPNHYQESYFELTL